MEIPNLDGMDQSELEHAANAFHHLRQYASIKAEAMMLRADGDIAAALRLETICQEHYRHLPEWARW